MASLKFETFKDKAGEFRFNLLDEDGKVLLKSEGYTAKASRDNGIESVKKNGVRPNRFEKNFGKKATLNLTSTNGQVVASSTLHETEADLDALIEKVSKNVEKADVEERA